MCLRLPVYISMRARKISVTQAVLNETIILTARSISIWNLDLDLNSYRPANPIIIFFPELRNFCLFY